MKQLLLIALLSAVLVQGLEGAGRGTQVKSVLNGAEKVSESNELQREQRALLLEAMNHRNVLRVGELIGEIPVEHLYDEILVIADKQGRTLLHLAAAMESIDMVKIVLEAAKKCCVLLHLMLTRDLYGWTALHYAVYHNNIEIVDALLAADPNESVRSSLVKIPDIGTRRAGRWTALHLAAERGSVAVVEKLLEVCSKNARPDFLRMQDDVGWTALHVAVEYKHVDVVCALLKYVPELELSSFILMKNRCGYSAMRMAEEDQEETIVDIFKEFAPSLEALDYSFGGDPEWPESWNESSDEESGSIE